MFWYPSTIAPGRGRPGGGSAGAGRPGKDPVEAVDVDDHPHPLGSLHGVDVSTKVEVVEVGQSTQLHLFPHLEQLFLRGSCVGAPEHVYCKGRVRVYLWKTVWQSSPRLGLIFLCFMTILSFMVGLSRDLKEGVSYNTLPWFNTK